MEDEAILLMRYGADPNIPDTEGERVVTHPKATNVRLGAHALGSSCECVMMMIRYAVLMIVFGV